MVTSKGPKVDPRKKENQIAAMCVAADEPKCTGGLRMIKERAGNKNLPVLFARLIIFDFAGKVDYHQTQV